MRRTVLTRQRFAHRIHEGVDVSLLTPVSFAAAGSGDHLAALATPGGVESASDPRNLASLLRLLDEVSSAENGDLATIGAQIAVAAQRGPYVPVEGVVVHAMHVDDVVQVGIVAGITPEAIASGRVRPHEQTMPGRVAQLVDVLTNARVDSAPVTLAHPNTPQLTQWLHQVMAGEPQGSLTTADGVQHVLWIIDTANPALAALPPIDEAIIVDGHHRVAAVDACAPNGPTVLAEFVLYADVHLHAFDRLLLTTPETAARLVAQLAHVAHAQPVLEPPARPTDGSVCVGADGQWWRVPPASTARFALPHEHVAHLLAHHAGVHDPRTDNRLRAEPETAMDAPMRAGEVRFVTRRLTMDDLVMVVDAGQRLPPKTTFVTPRTLPGLFLRRHDAGLAR